MKKIIIIALIVVIAIFGVLIFKGKNKKEVFSAKIEKVKIGEIKSQINVEGEIEVKNEEDIYVDKALTVKEVFIEEGDFVNKGDTLILFDTKRIDETKRSIKKKKIEIENLNIEIEEKNIKTSDSGIRRLKNDIVDLKNQIKIKKLKIETTKNEIVKLELDLNTVKKDYEDNKILFESNGISKNSLTESKNEYDKTQINIEKYKNDLKTYELELINNENNLVYTENELLNEEKDYENLEKTRKNNILILKNRIKTSSLELEGLEEDLKRMPEKIVSPVDGTILSKRAEKNYLVDTTEKLMTIADINSQIITAKIGTYDIASIYENQEVEILSDVAEDKVFVGKIVKISPFAIKEQTSSYEESVVEIEVEFENEKNILKPGYFIDLNIISEKKDDAIIISSFAVMRNEKKPYIYLLGKDKTAIKKYIEIGIESDLELEVLNLEEGKKIITNPSKELKDGDKVSLDIKNKKRNPNKKDNKKRKRPSGIIK